MKFIELTQGKRAIVDDADFNWLNQWKWFALKGRGGIFYADRMSSSKGGKKQQHILMHRFIMDTPVGMDTDHVNGNTLDCRRFNLRVVTHQENIFNKGAKKNSTSKFRGVYWHKLIQKWVAQVCLNGKNIHLGSFKSQMTAAKIYNQKAKELFGEFARLNPV